MRVKGLPKYTWFCQLSLISGTTISDIGLDITVINILSFHFIVFLLLKYQNNEHTKITIERSQSRCITLLFLIYFLISLHFKLLL